VVLVLVDGAVSLNEIWFVEDVARKAGFVKFRYFVLGPDRQSMSEIKLGPSVPFSTNLPVG